MLASLLCLCLCLAYPPAPKEAAPPKGVHSLVWIITPKEGNPIESTGVIIDLKQKLICMPFSAVESVPIVNILFPRFTVDGKILDLKEDYKKELKSSPGIRAKVLFAERRRDAAILQIVGDDIPKTAKAATARFDAPVPPAVAWWIGCPEASDKLWKRGDLKIANFANVVPVAPAIGFMGKNVGTDAKPGAECRGAALFNADGEWIGIARKDSRDFTHVSELKEMCFERRLKMEWKEPAK